MTIISKKIVTFPAIQKQRKVQIEKQPIQQIYQKNNEITFIEKNNAKCLAEVINHTGKATYKYDSCYNIEYKPPSASSGPKTWIEIVYQAVTKIDEILETHCDKFQITKEKELENQRDNGVYGTAPNENQKCTSLRWVLLMKEIPEVLQPKARLVARGLEENCINKTDKESPTWLKDSLRTIIVATV